MEELLQQKTDHSEFQSLASQIQSKSDVTHTDNIIRMLDQKMNLSELEVIKQELNSKAYKHDFEML